MAPLQLPLRDTMVNPSRQELSLRTTSDAEFAKYFEALGLHPNDPGQHTNGIAEENKTAPVFSWHVHHSLSNGSCGSKSAVFEQYAVLGLRLGEVTSQEEQLVDENSDAKHAALILQNTNSPWSAFICGSQGSGKSYTLSCMLENCLLPLDKIGRLPKPLTGMVFHYDSHSMGAPCEAAYICSAGVPVTVLVSPSNYLFMKQAYSKFESQKGKVSVKPLVFQDQHLNIEHILKLMAFSDKEESVPLYMEVINRILRRMAITAQGTSGFDYAEFRRQLDNEEFGKAQQGPMRLRLNLLESFLDPEIVKSSANRFFGGGPKQSKADDVLDFKPGTLTIVDLTDPFVDAASACVLFDICLGLLFKSDSGKDGRVVALDEAHKFMDKSSAAQNFTNSLLTAIREQRHTATRIIIATQEPTISPRLLDLCSLTLVHRFTSPEWLATLKGHLAAASVIAGGSQSKLEDIVRSIVNLNVGESLLFAPSALLELEDGRPRKLGTRYIKLKTRQRIGEDGGRSILSLRNGN